MTRNDAYKAARYIWRTEMKRGKRSIVDSLKRLRFQNVGPRDIQMVRLWVRAFQSGRRYPDEASMQHVERTDY